VTVGLRMNALAALSQRKLRRGYHLIEGGS
jgi:hypothetical protein